MEGVQVGLGGVLRELGCSPGTLIPRAEAAVTPAQTPRHGEWHHCPLHGGSPGRGLTSQQKSQLGEVSKGTTNACDKLQEPAPLGRGLSCYCKPEGICVCW